MIDAMQANALAVAAAEPADPMAGLRVVLVVALVFLLWLKAVGAFD